MAQRALEGEGGESKVVLWGRTPPWDCNSQRAPEVHRYMLMHERWTMLSLKYSSDFLRPLAGGRWEGPQQCPLIWRRQYEAAQLIYWCLNTGK